MTFSPISTGTEKQKVFAADCREAAWNTLREYAKLIKFSLVEWDDVPFFRDYVQDKCGPKTAAAVLRLLGFLGSETGHRKWINTSWVREIAAPGERLGFLVAELESK